MESRGQSEANPNADKTAAGSPKAADQVNTLVQIRKNGKTLGFSTGMQIEIKS